MLIYYIEYVYVCNILFGVHIAKPNVMLCCSGVNQIKCCAINYLQYNVWLLGY